MTDLTTIIRWKSWINRQWLRLLTLAIAVMPLAFAQSSRWKLLPFICLAIAGLALTRRLTTQTPTWFAQIKPLIIVMLIWLAVALLNVFLHGIAGKSLGLTPQILIFLTTTPTFLVVRNRQVIWLAFSATGALLGGVALVQCYFLHAPRAFGLNGGPWSAIEFGMFQLTLCLLSINCLLSPQSTLPRRLFHGICASFALYGAVLTDSRGPLLAFPIMAGLLIYFHYRTAPWRYFLAAIALVSAFSSVGLAVLRPELLTRLQQASLELQTYDARLNASGAVRERLEMWRMAWAAIQAHPWIGIGLGQFGPWIRQHIATGQANPSIGRYKNPHNEYLEAAATLGLPGLIALLGVFLVPLQFFIQQAIHPTAPGAEAARGGTMVIGLYMLCGLTDNVFYRAMPHSLYFFLVLGFALWSVQTSPWLIWRD